MGRGKKKNQVQTYDLESEKPCNKQIPTLHTSSGRLRAVYTSIPTSQTKKAIPPAIGEGETVRFVTSDAAQPVNQRSNPANINVRPKAKRYTNSDNPLGTWKNFRQDYLDQILALDGRGRYHSSCSNVECHSPNPVFRCLDCFGRRMYCKSCIVSRHKHDPLHRIEEWGREYFHKVPLAKLGVQAQLGHASGLCPNQKQKYQEFVVIDVTGIHTISLNFCGCPGASKEYEQLLEMGWWPSTPLEPRTAATFSVLSLFHLLNLQGHIAPTDFYRGLEQLGNGSGLDSLPDRLPQWMIMVREWRHIKMSKRAGRGHDPAGVDQTSPGELTVACRSCPHPGKNLPFEWQSAPDEERWKYTLFLAEDANFRQKARIRDSKNIDDPLGPGWGTFVSNIPYLNYVSQFANQEEISHCVGFAALWSANKRKSKGLRATGVAAVSCARHELYRPNGMGDLQIGERYCNMDYLFLSALIGVIITSIVVSYDIACQWGANFWTRAHAPTMPEQLRLRQGTEIRYMVPKFHLEAHTRKCHAPYSFNYANGVGRTDGEGVERNWSVLNGIASSVSMMGAGGRWDTIDDFCNFLNHRKTVTLPGMYLRKMTQAIPQAIIHHRAFSAFTESLKKTHAEKILEWETAVLEWEDDHDRDCPYDLPDLKISLTEVKQQLQQEDHDRVTKGEVVIDIDGMSPADFIVEALEIEEAQEELYVDVKDTTLAQESTFLRRRTNLLRRIQRYTTARAKFLPGLSSYLLSFYGPEVSKSTPELIPLHLPSSIPPEHRRSVCLGSIDGIEERLRFAQASEALVQLRLQLAKRTCAIRYQGRSDVSQRYFTRFRELQEQNDIKIKTARIHYNTARQAILGLRGPGDWEETYQLLRAEDIVGLGERALATRDQKIDEQMQKVAGLGDIDLGKTVWDAEVAYSAVEPQPLTAFMPQLARGEGYRTLSWIWYSTGSQELENSSTDAYLRVEWLRCRARARGWKQEIQLLEEEMRRVIEFCRWKAAWWESLQRLRADSVLPHIAEGLRAYALEQADIERKRALVWASDWTEIRGRAKDVLEKHLGDSEEDSHVVFEVLNIELDDEDEGEVDIEFDDD